MQRDEYRDAKLRTILNTVPEALGPDGEGPDLSLDAGPRVEQERSGAALLISNNRYRLGRAVGSGTRPRIDAGVLGVTVASAPPGGAAQNRRGSAGASGPPPNSTSTPAGRSRPESTARR